MEALLARTAQTLRGRFEALRPGGPVPVLMAETPRDHPLPRRRNSSPPLPIFEWKYPSPPQWICGTIKILDHRYVANRAIWLGVELNASQAIRRVCREAAGLSQFIRRNCGLPVECGTNSPEAAWIWTVLEVAAIGVPGSLLKLAENGVFRIADGTDGTVWATEDELARAELIPPTANDLWSQIMRRNFDPTRYWLIEDLVEASVQVMDIVEVAIISGASAPAGADGSNAVSRTAPPSTETRHKRRSTKAIDVDGPLGKLETKMRKALVAELGSETAAAAALVERLYSLSAEDLKPMLRRVGCKASAKTISRSGKYDAWSRYRHPTAAPSPIVDVGPAALSHVRPRAADVTADAESSGHVSRRVGGRGAMRIGKTAAEKAAEDAANRFAKDAGVDLPPAE